jgi:NAD(P)-dependent dehydrogenase (short-subunit alcohol dehydrogenase family)
MGWTVQDMPGQAGKVAIVTGSNSGLGYETALALAGAGAETIVAARSREKGEAAVARIVAGHPQANVRFEALDLGSLGSVAAFAERIAAAHDRLDILVNNAGVMALPQRETTEDGYERQIGVNFLGHFALTGRLMPLLRATNGARAVQLSSLAHARRGGIDFDNFQGERDYQPWQAYSFSKLAMLMFALELDRRSRAGGWGVASMAAHPGWARSELIDNGMGKSIGARLVGIVFPLLAQSTAAGALPTLYAATAPEAESGTYYGPQGRGERRGPPGPARMSGAARDEAAARRLWEEAERLTGVTFPS